MRLIVVSGLSGSGKTIALQTLEDLGYYCVDNLPLQLLKPFAEAILARADGAFETIAVGIDARNFLDQLDDVPDMLNELRSQGVKVEIVFLQATDDALVRRYHETRRKHPLGQDGSSLMEAIRRERQLLQAISAHATLVIDTSQSNVHELRERVRNWLRDSRHDSLVLLFESFGYKHGVPSDADFVFDVRCLPNPHWDRKLRLLTGLDKPVRDFLSSQSLVEAMLSDLKDLLERWLPQFDDGSRSYLTVAIGCTGGQHRSVFMAAQLAEYFAKRRPNVKTRHRELGSL